MNRTTYTRRQLATQARDTIREQAKLSHCTHARMVDWTISVGTAGAVLHASGYGRKDGRPFFIDCSIAI